MFERMKPKYMTYKCELGKCGRFAKCGGGAGIRGEKLLEVKRNKMGLIWNREEYYNCLRFVKRGKGLGYTGGPKQTQRSKNTR